MGLARRQFLHLVAAAAAVAVALSDARAQTYPSRPITIVAGFAAGGPTDVIARIMAEHIRGSLGQPVIVENNAAAGGSIAAARVARAAPDGYTIAIGHVGTHVFNGAIYSLQYDVLNDFEPLGLIAANPQMIIVKNAMPANNLKEFLAWLSANPGKASQGHGGIGTPGHIAGIFFQKMTGTEFERVPYRGAAPALQDLVAGQVDLMFEQANSSLPHVRAGKVKAFAVTGEKPVSAAPEIPSVDEAGLPGFHLLNWTAMWAPKGTPKDIVTKINSAMRAALADPAMVQKLDGMGLQIFATERQTPEALRAHQKAEIEKWWPIIKAAGVKVE